MLRHHNNHHLHHLHHHRPVVIHTFLFSIAHLLLHHHSPVWSRSTT
jgi:hypothetical protein